MIQCSNCGQVNARESNFCRSCGTKVTQVPQANYPVQWPTQGNDFEYAPPRPHVWKTDEFQLPENNPQKQRPTAQAERVQPLANLNAAAQQQTAGPRNLAQYRPANAAYGYRCPRCASQLLPKIERKISAAGWVVFAVLLVVFFPLFWIGFLIKEDIRVCPVCNLRIS